MVLLDTTILTVALPKIGETFSASVNGLQWVSNSYTIVFAALLLSAGTLADRFGARRVFLAGAIGFGAISAVCAAAGSLESLVALRGLLGISGALILPSSLAIIAVAFPDAGAKARALGNWAAISGVALVAGPPIGGVLTDTLGWRSIFVINLPIAAVSAAIVWRHVHATPVDRSRGLDSAGQICAILCVAALTYGLIQYGSFGLTSAVAAAATLGVFAAFAFIRTQRRSPTETAVMLPRRLFADAAFSASLICGVLVNFALFGDLFVLALYFQNGFGYAASTTGLALLPLTLPTMFAPIFSGRLIAAVGPRKPATAGFCLMALGSFANAFALSGTLSGTLVGAIGLLAVGIGTSLVIPTLIVTVMGSVPRDLAGIGGGAVNSARQIGSVLGVALLGTVLSTADTPEAGREHP